MGYTRLVELRDHGRILSGTGDVSIESAMNASTDIELIARHHRAERRLEATRTRLRRSLLRRTR